MPNESTILLVEEFPDDVFIIRHALQAAGIENPVRVAWGGQEAIAYLNGEGDFASRENFPLPVLVLLELNLSKLSGMEVLRWIRQQAHLACLRVILLTASIQASAKATAYRLGAAAVLTKPGRVRETARLMGAISAQWLAPSGLVAGSGPTPSGEEKG